MIKKIIEFSFININKSFYDHHKVWCSVDFNDNSCHKHQEKLFSVEELFIGNLFGTNKRINILVMKWLRVPVVCDFFLLLETSNVTRFSLRDYITLLNYIMKILSASSWPIILVFHRRSPRNVYLIHETEGNCPKKKATWNHNEPTCKRFVLTP